MTKLTKCDEVITYQYRPVVLHLSTLYPGNLAVLALPSWLKVTAADNPSCNRENGCEHGNVLRWSRRVRCRWKMATSGDHFLLSLQSRISPSPYDNPDPEPGSNSSEQDAVLGYSSKSYETRKFIHLSSDSTTLVGISVLPAILSCFSTMHLSLLCQIHETANWYDFFWYLGKQEPLEGARPQPDTWPIKHRRLRSR